MQKITEKRVKKEIENIILNNLQSIGYVKELPFQGEDTKRFITRMNEQIMALLELALELDIITYKDWTGCVGTLYGCNNEGE